MVTRIVLSVIALAGPLICRAQTSNPSLEEQRRAIEEQQCSPEVGKILLKDRDPGEFVVWRFEELPNDIKGTVGVLEGPMRRQALPHKTVRPLEVKDGLDLRVGVFAARDSTEDDVVEYRWTYGGKALRLVVSRNATALDFALDQLSGCRQGDRAGACVAGARAWVEEVLELRGEYSILEHHIEYCVDLPWPNELRDGVWFSSAPEQNLMRLRGMPFWHDRVDAFVENGTLSILIYRKVGQLLGYQDGSQWFSDDFRELIHRKAAEQGKTQPEAEGADE